MRKYTLDSLNEQNLKVYVDQILFDLRTDLEITKETFIHYSLHIAIWEILLNIVSHNDKLTDHHVFVCITWTGSEIMIQIEDPDGGFDWKACMKDEPPEPNQSRGRGLFIIKAISKHFGFEDNGKVACITFDRP